MFYFEMNLEQLRAEEATFVRELENLRPGTKEHGWMEENLAYLRGLMDKKSAPAAAEVGPGQ